MQNVRAAGLGQRSNEVHVADITRRLLPVAFLQVGDDLCHQRGPVRLWHDLGAQGHCVGALRTARMLQLAGGRITEVPLEIGRDPGV